MTKIESLESMQKRQRKAIVDFYQSLNILSAEFNYNTISEENLKWKKRMYEVSVMEEINAHAKEGDGLVYSVKSLYNKRNIDYKKQAKELINILKKEFNK